MALAMYTCVLFFTFISSINAITLPSAYDVIWDSPGLNHSADSMPVGGGDIGLNTWSENGTILFYIAKSGTFDENNALLKLGRVRLTFDPNPFSGNGHFEQRLAINDGHVTYTGKDNTTAKLWVDVFNPVIHLEVNSPQPVSVSLAYENWRFQDRRMVGEERNQGSWGIYTSKVPNGTTYADVVDFHKDGVLMSHRNENLDLWNFQVTQQKLEDFEDKLYNPMRNNEFGLWVHSPDLKPGNVTSGHYVNTTFKAWNLVASAPKTAFNIGIALYQNQTETHDEWLAKLEEIAGSAINNSQDASIAWWHQYWDRSYIIINEDAGPRTSVSKSNQRLLYWPLLRTGDFDVMKAQFDFYKRITPNALIRGQHYHDIDAAYFLEQGDNTGLSNVFEYHAQWYDDENPIPRPSFFPDGDLWNVWLSNLQETANEFADMILQANMYSGLDVTPYLDFIEYQLAWFDKYYRKEANKRSPWQLDGYYGNETLIIYPASAAETYKESYNPSSTTSGLRKLITDLLAVDQYKIENRTHYLRYLATVPPTPLREQQGRICIAPALAYTRIQNSETPQLYPVFPWGEYGLGRPNLTVALDTYLYDTETQAGHGNKGWNQDVIWLARLGQTANATAMTEARFRDSDVCKFPAFKGPNFDWTPDFNHYGAAALGLHEQLVQTFVGDDIRLLAAWPDRWSARFKVWAPRNTTVEGTVERGNKMGSLTVLPESRGGDVIYGQG
ncbi:hypothetical protein PG987_000953 [Apiospora arundinis]